MPANESEIQNWQEENLQADDKPLKGSMKKKQQQNDEPAIPAFPLEWLPVSTERAHPEILQDGCHVAWLDGCNLSGMDHEQSAALIVTRFNSHERLKVENEKLLKLVAALAAELDCHNLSSRAQALYKVALSVSQPKSEQKV